jgi:hypothetical protein
MLFAIFLIYIIHFLYLQKIFILRIDPNKTNTNTYTLKYVNSKDYGKNYFGGTLINVRTSQTDPKVNQKTQRKNIVKVFHEIFMDFLLQNVTWDFGGYNLVRLSNVKIH